MATTQADEAAEAIRRGFGYNVSLSGGDLSYRQHVVVGDAVAVSDLHLGARIRLDLDPTAEFMFVQLRAGTYAYNPWNRQRTLGPGGSFLIPPEQSLQFEIDHADVSTCSFSAATLFTTAREVFDLDDATISEGAAQPVDAGKGWLWTQTVDAFRRHVLTEPATYGNNLIRAEATRFLVVNAISSFGLVDLPVEQREGGAALRRAIVYIDEHLASPMTVQDIATAARLSPRGLSTAFQRERAQTPMQYVRAGRLAGARRDLQAADPTRGDTVAGVAASWGFSNAGRFTAEYRRAFGMSPRETLHA